MRLRIRSRLLPLVLSLPVLAPAALPAGENPLSFGVPADVHFFVRAAANPERDALDAPYVAAMVRLWDSGILDDVLDLALTDASREEAERVRAIVDQVLETLGKVEWAKLFEKEFSFAFRLAMGPPEYVFLFRVPEAGVEAYRGQLRGLLEDFAAFEPNVLQVRDSEGPTGTRSSLVIQGAPFGLFLGATEDAIVLATSQAMLTSSTRLLRAGTGEGSIAKDPGFRRGLERVGAAPTDTEWYMNVGAMCEFVGGMIGMAGMGAPPQARPVIETVSACVNEFSALRSVVGTEKVKGNRYIADTVLLLEEGSSDRFLGKLLGLGRNLEGFERGVPREASAFSSSAGSDLAGAYDALLTAVRENTLEGEGLLQKWEGIQQQFGFNLRDDLLVHLSGGSTSVCFPNEKGGSEWVCRVGIANEQAVSSAVANGLQKALGYLRERDQGGELRPVEGAAGLQEVRLEAFPRFHPVVGVAGGHLVLASSGAAVRRTTQLPKGEGILDNPRFRSLELGIDGPVGAVYYANVEGQMEGFAQILSGIGFFASLLPAQRETRPIVKLGAILTKLGRFFREIDLELDRGGFARSLPNGEGLFYRTVSTFRKGD
jgi:hypothetical protein